MARLNPSLTRLVARLLPRVIHRKLADPTGERDDMLASYRSID